MACGRLSFVDEGDVEGKERVNVVVGCGFGDCPGVLGAVSAVRSGLFDGDDEVGEESCFSGGSKGCGSGRRGGDTLVNCHRGGCVRRRRGKDSDGDGVSAGRSSRGGDGASGNEGMSWDTGVVFADGLPGKASTIRVAVAASLWWRKGRWNDGGCGGCSVRRGDDTDVVLADGRVGITTLAVLVGHATNRDCRGCGANGR